MRLLVQKIAEKESNEDMSSLEMDLMTIIEKAIIFRVKVEIATGRGEWNY